MLKIKVNTIKRPKFLSRDNVFKMKAVQHAYKEICKKEKPSLIISLQANSPNMRTFDIDKCIEKLISNNLNEVISTDINYNQNGAIRVMLPSAVLQDSLSTHCGFLITDISDVHTIDDIKKLNKKNNEN